jgi:hypothetical protein
MKPAMPLIITCPACAAKLRTRDRAAGRSITCPKCDQVIAGAAMTPSRRGQPSGSRSRGNRDEGLSIQRNASSVDEADGPRVALGLGIASLVLSILGLVFSIFSWISWMFTVPLSSLGLLLGGIGAIMALQPNRKPSRRNSRRGSQGPRGDLLAQTQRPRTRPAGQQVASAI